MSHTGAGRELDALVAEKVMGLVPCTAEIHATGDMLPCHASPASPDMGAETPCYSTDIAAAWEVVEEMRRRGYEVIVSALPGKPSFSCEIAKPSWQGSEVEEAPSAPHAICLAALAATEAK